MKCFILLFCVAVISPAFSIDDDYLDCDVTDEKCQEYQFEKAVELYAKPRSTRRSDEEQHVLFRWYTKNTINRPFVVDSRGLVKMMGLDPRKPLKITIHGWLGNENCLFTSRMMHAFLPRFDYNVITVDWSHHGSQSKLYPNARNSIFDVAIQVASFLDFLAVFNGIKLENVHIIGHSLGAHIAGLTGKLVSQGKIGRISGMDPAGPLFSDQEIQARLSPDAAKFVDVIHTSIHFLGFTNAMGHVDFYPNGGTKGQPGCGADVTVACSHRRSYEYFIDSLTNPKSFLAVKCESWEHYLRGQCNLKDVIPMGIAVPITARGIYFLSTAPKSPFGLGAI